MKRLFFALWPSESTRNKIDTFKQAINANELKKVTASNLHITLVFVGNIDSNSEIMLRQSMGSIKAQTFKVYFKELTFWSKPRILCLTTQQYDKNLLSLVNALNTVCQQCGIKTEERPYQPHITLARKARTLIKAKAPCIEWQAQSFCLVESRNSPNGIHYQVLQEWNF